MMLLIFLHINQLLFSVERGIEWKRYYQKFRLRRTHLQPLQFVHLDYGADYVFLKFVRAYFFWSGVEIGQTNNPFEIRCEKIIYQALLEKTQRNAVDQRCKGKSVAQPGLTDWRLRSKYVSKSSLINRCL